MWRLRHPDVGNCFTVWDEKTSARAFNEGVRIDYVLCSKRLIDQGQVVSCEVLTNIPPKWSDHAALLLELRDVPPVPKHPPCALSSLKMKRFHDPSQRSIASMFGAAKKRSKPAPPESGGPVGIIAPAQANDAGVEGPSGDQQLADQAPGSSPQAAETETREDAELANKKQRAA